MKSKPTFLSFIIEMSLVNLYFSSAKASTKWWSIHTLSASSAYIKTHKMMSNFAPSFKTIFNLNMGHYELAVNRNKKERKRVTVGACADKSRYQLLVAHFLALRIFICDDGQKKIGCKECDDKDK